MKKSILFLATVAMLVFGLSECTKKDVINPKVPSNSNPIIYGNSNLSTNINGLDMYSIPGGYCYSYMPKSASFYFRLKNNSNASIGTFRLEFKSDQPIQKGIYSTELGNLDLIYASYESTNMTNYTFDQTQGDNIKITIDSVYGQSYTLLLFGKMEIKLRQAGTTQKIIFSEGQFGYTLK